MGDEEEDFQRAWRWLVGSVFVWELRVCEDPGIWGLDMSGGLLF